MNVMMTILQKLLLYNVIIILTFALSTSTAWGQSAEELFQAEYEKNIQKSRIDGVYIPKDLEEAFTELEALSSSEAISKFQNAPENIIAHKLHFGLGRWIDYNWNLEKGSRYEHYLRGLGLKQRDHMIQFTIVSWHRHLNNRPINISAQVAAYDKIIQQELEKRARIKEINSVTIPLE